MALEFHNKGSVALDLCALSLLLSEANKSNRFACRHCLLDQANRGSRSSIAPRSRWLVVDCELNRSSCTFQRPFSIPWDWDKRNELDWGELTPFDGQNSLKPAERESVRIDRLYADIWPKLLRLPLWTVFQSGSSIHPSIHPTNHPSSMSCRYRFVDTCDSCPLPNHRRYHRLWASGRFPTHFRSATNIC